jgi:tetratricopeptide (TPR) repeat protein
VSCALTGVSYVAKKTDPSLETKNMQRAICGRAVSRIVVATIAGLAFAQCVAAGAPAGSGVKVTEEKVTIPTYLIGEPDPNPEFYFGGDSQGAQHRIYPYPAYDNLTTEKKDKTYTMVYLENEYVKIGILPEIGGKVFEAIDKTNGYDFIYHQHVIKPALISLLGAWISGGIEWDIPHHHRATSFLPMQYKIEANADGSKTVWVGELELRDRMAWTVGLTLHPGKSYLEASFRMVNRTPVPTSMLCFSNVAVHVNDTYQVIFPPSTQFVTYHAKRDFTTWPIATTKFNGTDYTAGVDVSWYKNHATASSMFAWNYQDDFMAGYDHGKNAGIMSIADHNVVPGKKFWTWGNGPSGLAEDHLLTDADGPYIELMVGAYSDNQPDYSWLEPGETREWTQYWYPFKDIDGVKNANIEAAVNLEVKDGNATVGFYSTEARPAATVTLKLKDQVLMSEKIAISPGHPFVKQVALPSGVDEHDLRAAMEAGGRELVAYTPVRLEKETMPSPVVPPPAPADVKTTEELYLAGLRMEQFHSPTGDPNAYWQEALRRDPGDVRVNTVLGIDAYKGGRYVEAERYLRKALERATASYTSPKDGEPFYYLGLTLKAEGKLDDGYTQLYKSTWSAAWRSPGYFAMAEIESTNGDVGAALTHDEDALEANALNVRALALKAALLRKAGKKSEAANAIAKIEQIDPLDVQGITEQWLATGSAASEAALMKTVKEHPETALEVAADDMDAGLWQDGSTVLTRVVSAAPDKAKVSPLMYYYLGYFAEQMHEDARAREEYALAKKASPEYVFPFQMEMMTVLEDAMRVDATDARAPYYEGNLLFDWQPQRAQELWEQSAALGADFPVVYRNLAMVYTREGGQKDKARAALEKAVEYGGNATVLSDLDKIYEEDGVSPAKRLAVMEAHQSVINRDEVIAREVNLYIFAGKPEAAIALLKTRFFRAWEGGGRFSLGDSWVNANLALGQKEMAAKQYAGALKDYKAAMEVPATLQEAAGDISGRAAEIDYWIGGAYEAMGDTASARGAWTEAASGRAGTGGSGPLRGRGNIGGLAAGVRVAQASSYYQALAMERLGQAEQAKAIFNQLIDTGAKELSGDASAAPGAAGAGAAAMAVNPKTQVADGHYLVGLGQLGLNNKEKARQEFSAALEASPDHFAANSALRGLGQ